MPVDEFLALRGDQVNLSCVPILSQRFGSSYESTVYRLATATPGVAIAGLLRYRHRKDELRKLTLARQRDLFLRDAPQPLPIPKYRRQAFHPSDSCSPQHSIPWNKSFDESSVVYRARDASPFERCREALPNQSGDQGWIEAVIAPYQREGGDTIHPDVLFLWWR